MERGRERREGGRAPDGRTDGGTDWANGRERRIEGLAVARLLALSLGLSVEFDGCLAAATAPLSSNTTAPRPPLSRGRAASLPPSLSASALMVLTKKNLREIPAELGRRRRPLAGLPLKDPRVRHRKSIKSQSRRRHNPEGGCQSSGNDDIGGKRD